MSRAEPMPVIKNTSQQVVAKAMKPKPAYSRVVSVSVHCDVLGTVGYNVTQPVGNNVWLSHVKVRVTPKAMSIVSGTAFYIYAGQGIPHNEASVASWQNVLPLIDPNRAPLPWTLYDSQELVEWDMNMLFKGENRRFGVRAMRVGGVAVDALFASFTISEG